MTALPFGLPGERSSLHDLHLVAAGLGVELDPVRRRRAADEHELVLLEVEQDAVADDVAAVAARHELLGAVDREIVEAVDREVREELQRVRALRCTGPPCGATGRTARRSCARRPARRASCENSRRHDRDRRRRRSANCAACRPDCGRSSVRPRKFSEPWLLVSSCRESSCWFPRTFKSNTGREKNARRRPSEHR